MLLLDEPFSAVDRMTREPLKEEIAALHRALDIPMLLVTHDLEEAQALADRICVLHAGTTLQIGTPDEVRLRPQSALVAQLMGQTNVFPAVVESAHAVRWGAHSLAAANSDAFHTGTQVSVLIPPDAIALVDGEANTGNVLEAILTETKPLADMTQLTVGVGEARLRFKIGAREAASRKLHVGDALRVHLDPAGIHLMSEN